MTTRMEPGDSIGGLIVDGVEGTPYVGATLRFRPDFGIEVEIPFQPESDQFRHVAEWFNKREAPKNLVFMTPDGPIGLYGTRWLGHSMPSGRRLHSGRFTAAEVLLYWRDTPLGEPLEMTNARSAIDGLSRWSQLTALTMETETGDDRLTKGVTIELKGVEPVIWRQGEATMVLSAGWTHHAEQSAVGERTVIDDRATLESRFDTPRSFSAHFEEQRKIANLLVFLYGRPIAFRQHHIKDDSITQWIGQEKLHHPFVEIISDRTATERREEGLSLRDRQRLLIGVQQIGPSGLTKWAENYDEWQRFILPSVAVLSRRSAYAEDVVVSTSMAMEAAGAKIGKRPGEEVTYKTSNKRNPETTATYVFRCIDRLGLPWGAYVQSCAGLAKGIANTYNDIKHADRGDFPADGRTQVVSFTGQFLIRLLALTLIGDDDAALSGYRNESELWQIRQRFEGWNLRIDDEGHWHKTEPLGRAPFSG